MGSLFDIDGGGREPALFVRIQHPGPPRGKGRPRFRYVQAKGSRAGFVTVYTDAETAAYEAALKWRGKAAMQGRPLLDVPLAVRIFAMVPVPASWSMKKRDQALSGLILPSGRPDFDNYAKIACDSLNETVWTDDSLITRALVLKEYAEKPGLIVEVYKLV